LVPVVHLGALMSDGTPPAERGRTAVLVEIGAGEGARRVAFEVEDADAVVRWSRSSISTRWETASDDGGRRRPARHVQGGRPGLRVQHLPGGAHPPLRGTGAVAQGPRL